jgi:uncharacterized membrane protein YGL010W
MRLNVSNPMREKLVEYTGAHRVAANEACHFIGIPSIIAGAATLLGALPLFRVDAVTVTPAELVAFAIVVFYLVSARLLGLITSVIFVALVTLGRALPLVAGLALFFGGWALQFVGHAVYEKTKPAFLRNLLHLLVGPAWLVERALGRLHLVSS